MPVIFSALVHPPGKERGPGAGEVNAGGVGVFRFVVCAAEGGAAEQTPGSLTGQRRTQLGGRRDGGGWDGGRAGWWQPTSQPAYLLGYVPLKPRL